jgi:hypothetical protein
VRRRLITIAVLLVAGGTALLAVPGLHEAARKASSISPLWPIGAVGLELASCVSFLAIFRRFFDEDDRVLDAEPRWRGGVRHDRAREAPWIRSSRRSAPAGAQRAAGCGWRMGAQLSDRPAQRGPQLSGFARGLREQEPTMDRRKHDRGQRIEVGGGRDQAVFA